MPYIPDDEKDQQNAQQNQSVQISGASPTTDSSGNTQQGQQTPGQGKNLNTGSGYQNLDKYIQANSGQNFGGQLVDKVQGDVTKASNNIDSASTSFSNKVNSANSVPTSDQVNQAIANPTGANAQDFQKWEHQSYAGPTSVSGEDYNNLWKGTNDASTKAGYLGTEPGRFTLLDSYYGKPSYSQGQKGLDNLLVQNQSGIGSQIQNVQSQANQLKGTAQNAQSSLQNQATSQAKAVQDSAAGIQSQVGNAFTSKEQDINNAVADQNSQRGTQVSQLQHDLSSNTLSDAELSQLGISRGQNLYNVNLDSYLTAGGALNKDQVMTPDQRSYLQALSQLSGVDDNYAAGTAQDPTAAFSYNGSGLQSAINSAKSDYGSAANAAALAAYTKNFGAPGTWDADPDKRIASLQKAYTDSQSGKASSAYGKDLIQAYLDLQNKYTPTRKT